MGQLLIVFMLLGPSAAILVPFSQNLLARRGEACATEVDMLNANTGSTAAMRSAATVAANRAAVSEDVLHRVYGLYHSKKPGAIHDEP